MVANQRLICLSADLIDGGAGVRFTVPGGESEEPAFAVRFRGRVAAYLNRCGHVPVELDWQPNEFFDDSKLYLICSVHGALYAPETGRCLGGRCQGKGLAVLAVDEADGQVFLVKEHTHG